MPVNSLHQVGSPPFRQAPTPFSTITAVSAGLSHTTCRGAEACRARPLSRPHSVPTATIPRHCTPNRCKVMSRVTPRRHGPVRHAHAVRCSHPPGRHPLSPPRAAPPPRTRPTARLQARHPAQAPVCCGATTTYPLSPPVAIHATMPSLHCCWLVAAAPPARPLPALIYDLHGVGWECREPRANRERSKHKNTTRAFFLTAPPKLLSELTPLAHAAPAP